MTYLLSIYSARNQSTALALAISRLVGRRDGEDAVSLVVATAKVSSVEGVTDWMGRAATAIGLPAGMLATVLLLSAAGADNAGLAMLTFLSMMATLLAGLLGAGAMAFRGERSPWVVLVLVLAVLPLMFIVVELIFPHD